ncbi:MAG: DMT family transporter [Bacteroidota bacterium]
MRKYLVNTTILAIMACFLWSTAFAGIKIGLPFTEPLNFAGIRFFISGLLIMPLAGNIRNYFREVRQHIGFILRLSFFQTFTLYALFYTGISMVPGAVAAIIVGASPLFASLMAHFLMHDDKLSFNKLFSISFGMVGVIVIALGRGEFSLGEGKEFWGMIILIIANLSGNFGNIIIARNTRPISPLVLNSSQILIGGLMLFLLSIPIEGFELRIYPLKYYLSLGWLSFLSAAAFSIWFVLLRRPGVKVSYLNIWKFIIPVFGALLSWWLIPEEEPDVSAVAGMIIIGFSLIILNFNAVRQYIIRRRNNHT